MKKIQIFYFPLLSQSYSSAAAPSASKELENNSRKTMMYLVEFL
jgi:hypothetical protein